MIKDLSDNHLFNNYPCEAEDAKIESLRQQLAEMEDKYLVERGMRRLNSGEAESLRQQLASQREAFAVIAETPVSGEQDDITMEAKGRIAKAIRAWEPKP